MFSIAILINFLVPFIVCQTDQLEQECHILQTLEDLRNRLNIAEKKVTNLDNSLTNAETQMTNLKTSLANKETQVTNLETSLANTETQVTNLKTSLANTETQVTNLKSALTRAESQISQQATEITELQTSLERTEATTTALNISLTESVRSSNVVLFNVRDIGEQPTHAGSNIKFATFLENVGGDYNISSGCFIAPAQGVYWFSAQICTKPNKALRPGIYIRGQLYSRVYLFDTDTYSCGSATAVSVLEVGDWVCLSSTSITDVDSVSTDTFFNNFMGAIIN